MKTVHVRGGNGAWARNWLVSVRYVLPIWPERSGREPLPPSHGGGLTDTDSDHGTNYEVVGGTAPGGPTGIATYWAETKIATYLISVGWMLFEFGLIE
jgi:hypothetical protein